MKKMNMLDIENETYYYNGSNMLKLKHEQLMAKIDQGDVEACAFYLDLLDVEYNKNKRENNEQS